MAVELPAAEQTRRASKRPRAKPDDDALRDHRASATRPKRARPNSEELAEEGEVGEEEPEKEPPEGEPEGEEEVSGMLKEPAS